MLGGSEKCFRISLDPQMNSSEQKEVLEEPLNKNLHISYLDQYLAYLSIVNQAQPRFS